MTRQEQNQLILDTLSQKLIDLPNAKNVIDKVFATWFNGLLQMGMQMITSKEAAEAPAPEEGAEGGGEPAPAEG
jgi:hypothetical protein